VTAAKGVSHFPRAPASSEVRLGKPDWGTERCGVCEGALTAMTAGHGQ
jgi:hypothetical protein